MFIPLSELSQLNTRELLQCNLEQFVSDINTKRKRDTTLLEGGFLCYLQHRRLFLHFVDFKKDLELHCSAAYSSMQAALYSLYEQNSKVINDKLEELMSVMETIGMCVYYCICVWSLIDLLSPAKQEEELEQFKREMGAFLSDMQQ